jgi:hypothetical protein
MIPNQFKTFKMSPTCFLPRDAGEDEGGGERFDS